MAVPGHPFSSTAKGTNALIREGAILVRDAQDVLSGIGIDITARKPFVPESSIAKAIASTDGNGMTFDDLHAVTGIPVPQLIIAVESLELTGWVQRLPGGRVCMRNRS